MLLAFHACVALTETSSPRNGIENGIHRRKQGHAMMRNRRAKQNDDYLSTNATKFSPPATKRHVVIASFGEPEPYHAVSLYFASKLSGATAHHVIMHTYGKGHERGELNLKVEKEEEER